MLGLDDLPPINPPLHGIQRAITFRHKYGNILATVQDVHMCVNGSYDTSKEDFEENIEVLKEKLAHWVDRVWIDTEQQKLCYNYDSTIKLLIERVLAEAEHFKAGLK